MRSKIERIIYLQCIDNEEKMAEQAPPISRADMKLILEAYFKCGTADSIMRMAALSTNWSAAGRGSEVSTTTFNLYKWDRINNVSGYYWTQRKTSKSKGVYFVTDYDCIFLNHYYIMGLYLMSGQGQENYGDNESKNHWVFPEMSFLQDSGGSRKMSRFLQDLEKSSVSKLYKSSIIKELPEGITSGSMRDGSLSELMARNVPEGIIKMAGGHADAEFSSMFEYQIINATSTLQGT